MLAKVPDEFQEGHELNDKTAKKVPKGMIGARAIAQGGDGAFEEARVEVHVRIYKKERQMRPY